MNFSTRFSLVWKLHPIFSARVERKETSPLGTVSTICVIHFFCFFTSKDTAFFEMSSPFQLCKIAGMAARSLLLAGGALASSIRNDLAPNRLCRFGAVVVAAIAYESGTLNALVATTTTAPQAVPLSFRIEFAERTRFELVSRFRRLHAFQACLLNHSSISPIVVPG